jgi:hypothetical protein
MNVRFNAISGLVHVGRALLMWLPIGMFFALGFEHGSLAARQPSVSLRTSLFEINDQQDEDARPYPARHLLPAPCRERRAVVAVVEGTARQLSG